MKLELSVADKQVVIEVDGEKVGRLHYQLRRGNSFEGPAEVKKRGDSAINAVFKDGEIRDEIECTERLIRVRRSWKISGKGRWQLLFNYFPVPELPEWLVPAVMYEKNERGAGKFPGGGVEMGWSFREDRIPIPSCSILHNKSNWQAVFTSPALNEGELSSVRTFIEDGRPAFEIRVPYTEGPFTYTEKGIVLGGLTGMTEGFFDVSKAPFVYSRIFYIAIGAHKHIADIFQELTGQALDEFGAAENNHPVKADWSVIAALKLRHLKYLLIDEQGVTAIKQGKGNGLFQSFYEYTSGSFLCKSMEAAVILARVGGEDRNKEVVSTADRMGKFFLQGALPNGLHRDCYSLKNKQWGGYMGVGTPAELAMGANARCNGEVIVDYLRL